MMPIITPLPAFLDVLGIAVFALTGALAAAREKQTFVTMSFFALVTGVGGGSVRDLLIGAPVFWIRDPLVAPVCLLMAVIVWFTPVRIWSERLLEWIDGTGLAAYAVFGTLKAIRFGIPPVTAILMGIVTGCAGGIVRDMVAGRPSIIMQPEIYVTAAALSATLTAVALLAGVPTVIAGIAATIAGLVLRGAAIHWSLALPSYGGKNER